MPNALGAVRHTLGSSCDLKTLCDKRKQCVVQQLIRLELSNTTPRLGTRCQPAITTWALKKAPSRMKLPRKLVKKTILNSQSQSSVLGCQPDLRCWAAPGLLLRPAGLLLGFWGAESEPGWKYPSCSPHSSVSERPSP